MNNIRDNSGTGCWAYVFEAHGKLVRSRTVTQAACSGEEHIKILPWCWSRSCTFSPPGLNTFTHMGWMSVDSQSAAAIFDHDMSGIRCSHWGSTRQGLACYSGHMSLPYPKHARVLIEIQRPWSLDGKVMVELSEEKSVELNEQCSDNIIDTLKSSAVVFTVYFDCHTWCLVFNVYS